MAAASEMGLLSAALVTDVGAAMAVLAIVAGGYLLYKIWTSYDFTRRKWYALKRGSMTLV
jgi:hypothetical protein